jgi:hypothetical protein
MSAAGPPVGLVTRSSSLEIGAATKRLPVARVIRLDAAIATPSIRAESFAVVFTGRLLCEKNLVVRRSPE